LQDATAFMCENKKSRKFFTSFDPCFCQVLCNNGVEIVLTKENMAAYVRGTSVILREGVINMAYKHTNSKGVTYYLNSKAVVLRGGKEQTIYYFSKDQRPEATDLPAGMEVNENQRNGFLTVKRTK
jgi:hypothetical protein